jgi:hypothetical protein
MDIRFGTMLKSLYKAGSLKTAACELVKYNLDLVAVEETRWDEGDS